MAKRWVLDHETKGTGARMVPLEDVLEEGPGKAPLIAPDRKRAPASSGPPRREPKARQTQATALPPGHVRKKATGELGRVKAVDPKAGTATVTWLRSGTTSTVPISSISRR